MTLTNVTSDTSRCNVDNVDISQFLLLHPKYNVIQFNLTPLIGYFNINTYIICNAAFSSMYILSEVGDLDVIEASNVLN